MFAGSSNPYTNSLGHQNASSQAVQMAELEAMRARLDRAVQRIWESNKSLFDTQNRIFGSAPDCNKSSSPDIRSGLLGEISKVMDSLEEAASALEDRARSFGNLA